MKLSFTEKKIGIFIISFIITTIIILDGKKNYSSPQEQPKIFAEKNFIDSTGQLYDSKFLTLPDESATFVNGNYVPQDRPPLPISRLDQTDIDSAKGDALGVIVEFKKASILKKYRAANFKDKTIQSAIHQYRSSLKKDLETFKIYVKTTFGKEVIEYSPYPKDKKIRTITYTDVINGVALLDVGVAEAKDKLGTHLLVSRIHPNSRVEANLLDSVPMINVPTVWTYSAPDGTALDGTGMTIGIIDTGVDYTHSDLGGCLGPACKVAGGYDYVNNDSDPKDDHGHGTHVSAIAAGNGSYTAGDGSTHTLSGVAPAATIYAYKVLNSTGSGYSSAIILAIQSCADPNGDGNFTDRLDVCSMSLGGYGNPDDAMSIAVDNAIANGVVFTIAAGNNGPFANTILSPGTSRSAITVAASCKPQDIGVSSYCTQAIASFSSRGPVQWTNSLGEPQTLAKPDITAPGVYICAAEWGTYYSSSRCLDDKHIKISGTSMATPHVAGAAALLRQAHPEYSPAQIKQVLTLSATDLGFDSNTQGAGQIDAFAALNASGIPSSVARISEMPILIVDTPTTTIKNYSQTLTITNTSSQSLDYTPTFSTSQIGLSASFDQSLITIPAGGNAPLTMIVTVDHSQVPSGNHVVGTLILTTAIGEARASVTINILNRITVSPSTQLDFDVDMPEQVSWLTQKDVTLSNVVTDRSETFDINVSFTDPAITVTPSASQVTLTPAGTAIITVNLAVQNETLTNRRYSGVLTVSSSSTLQRSIEIPMTFYKGYGVKFLYSDITPRQVSYHNGLGKVFDIFYPPSTETQSLLYLNVPGPWFFNFQWGTNGTIQNYFVFKNNIALTVPTTEISVLKSDASHSISFNPISENGTPITSYISGFYKFIHRESGQDPMYYYFAALSGISVNVSDLDPSFTFVSSFRSADDTNKIFRNFSHRISDGIYGNVSLTNTVNDFVKKQVVAYQNREFNVASDVYVGNSFFVYNPYGEMRSPPVILQPAAKVTLNPRQLGTLYSSNKGEIDITNSPYPDYPSFYLVVIPLGSTALNYSGLYKSPQYYITKTAEYSWLKGGTGGLDVYATVPFSAAYNTLKVDFPPGNILPIGNSPLYDSSRWFNRDDRSSNSLQSQQGYFIPLHIFGGSSHEWGVPAPYDAQVASTYQIFRDNSLVSTGSMTWGSTGWFPQINLPKINGAVTPGNYRLELTRQAAINGVLTTSKTISTFPIVDIASYNALPVDENPPALKSLHLLSGGIWQNVIDPAAVNTLTFKVDPIAGFGNPASPPLPIPGGGYTPLADSLSTASLEISTDDLTWIPLTLTDLGQGAFQSDIPITQGISLYSFRISAADASNNSFSYTFQIPTGTSLDIQAPAVSIDSPIPDQSVEGIITISAQALDNAGISKVEFYVDSILLGSDSNSPYNFSWDTVASSLEAHSLTAKAYDTSGNTTISDPVTVNVIDSQAPAVSIDSPTPNQDVEGMVTLSALASDARGISKVEFYLDSALLGTDTSAPYSFSWDSLTTSLGAHSLTAKAYDGSGNTTISDPVTVNVIDSQVPVVSVDSPTPNQDVEGMVTLSALASDVRGISKVEFYLDSALLGTDTSAPYSFSWDSLTTSLGAHSLTAKAYDTSGNISVSAPVTVNVIDSTSPITTITQPLDNTDIKRGAMVTITANASDSRGVTKVEFYINGELKASDTSSPYSYVWNTKGKALGYYQLQTKAYDASGNISLSPIVTVRLIK